eukprot:scaffold14272_cov99-Isochrysis_galbana.AAC.7
MADTDARHGERYTAEECSRKPKAHRAGGPGTAGWHDCGCSSRIGRKAIEREYGGEPRDSSTIRPQTLDCQLPTSRAISQPLLRRPTATTPGS